MWGAGDFVAVVVEHDDLIHAVQQGRGRGGDDGGSAMVAVVTASMLVVGSISTRPSGECSRARAKARR